MESLRKTWDEVFESTSSSSSSSENEAAEKRTKSKHCQTDMGKKQRGKYTQFQSISRVRESKRQPLVDDNELPVRKEIVAGPSHLSEKTERRPEIFHKPEKDASTQTWRPPKSAFVPPIESNDDSILSFPWNEGKQEDTKWELGGTKGIFYRPFLPKFDCNAQLWDTFYGIDKQIRDIEEWEEEHERYVREQFGTRFEEEEPSAHCTSDNKWHDWGDKLSSGRKNLNRGRGRGRTFESYQYRHVNMSADGRMTVEYAKLVESTHGKDNHTKAYKSEKPDEC